MITVTKCDFNKVDEIENEKDKGLVGFCSFILDDGLYLGSIAVFNRLDGDGIRLVFPVRTSKKGMKFNIYNPINNETYDCLVKAVIKEMTSII